MNLNRINAFDQNMYLNTNYYTVSKKTIHLPFDHNLGKYRPIYKILLLVDC